MRLLCLASFTQHMCLRYLSIVVSVAYLFIAEWYFFKWMNCNFFYSSTSDGDLCYFSFGAIITFFFLVLINSTNRMNTASITHSPIPPCRSTVFLFSCPFSLYFMSS